MKKILKIGVTTLLLLLIAATIGTIVFYSGKHSALDEYTEFYILDKEGQAVLYPLQVSGNQSASLVVGLVNHEYITKTYHVTVLIDGDVYTTLGDIILDHNQKWERNVDIFQFEEDIVRKLEFLLYMDGKLYNELYLRVEVISE